LSNSKHEYAKIQQKILFDDALAMSYIDFVLVS